MVHENNYRINTSIAALKPVLLVFLSLASAAGFFVSALYRADRDALIAKFRRDEVSSVEVQFQAVARSLRHVFENLYFISRQNELIEFLDTGERDLIPQIENEYISMSRSSGCFDQIRLINRNGMEVVRVNDNNGEPCAVDESDLQNKSDRYYFIESFSKNRNEVFLSPFDLNVEKGEIEVPLKPTIRIATPVFNSNAEKMGIVVINYLGQQILDRIVEESSLYPGVPMLLNSDGFWLLSPSTEKNWGFMYGDEKRCFPYEFGAEWKRMADSDTGQFFTDKGLFTFVRIHPIKGSDRNERGRLDVFENLAPESCFWVLLSFCPQRLIEAGNRDILTRHLQMLSVLLGLIVCLSCSLFIILKKRLDHVEQLRSMALFDTLTGLPNRVLLFDRLTVAIEEAKRYGHMGAVLFIDLDGFKSVNDTCGHEMGDAFLKTVGSLITRCCRKADTVARIGGDEFAVVAGRLESAEDAGVIADKIITMISTSINMSAAGIQVGASIGISIFPEHGDDGDELLALADNAMYESKRKGKDRYTYHQVASSTLTPSAKA